MGGTWGTTGRAGALVAARDVRRFARLCVGLCLSYVLGGCYIGLQPYVAPTARVASTDRAVVIHAITEEAIARGLHVVQTDLDRGVVQAVSAPEDMGGVAIREHWRFEMTGNHLTVAMHPEERVPNGWHRVENVCETYTYAREHEALRAIRHAVRAGRPAASTREALVAVMTPE